MGSIALVLFCVLHDRPKCKRHAAGSGPGAAGVPRRARTAHCVKVEQRRAAAAQGQPAWAWLGLLIVPALVAARCPEPQLRFEPLAPGLWQVPAAGTGDADAANRGHVSHLLLAQQGPRLWLVGSGPSPAFGRALACQVRERFGRAPTDVISPWPRPELVLGIAGLGRVRSWAHADVAQAMRARCPGCVERLRARLGGAAVDLGRQPVRVPARLVHGSSGSLGPWRWWLLPRDSGHPVTVWQLQGSELRFAPGLLWGSGVPDARDAHVATLAASLAALPADVPRWLGEQGPLLGAEAPAAQARYLALLLAAVRRAQSAGEVDGGRAPAIAGIGPEAAADARHALNWQRAWRQEEEGPPPSPVPQRSLR
jgi:hypothetical protein